MVCLLKGDHKWDPCKLPSMLLRLGNYCGWERGSRNVEALFNESPFDILVENGLCEADFILWVVFAKEKSCTPSMGMPLSREHSR